MPNWNEILDEIQKAGSTYDVVRRKYLGQLSDLTGRNVIAYYSGWLQKRDIDQTSLGINDADKNGFMSTINQMDRTKGLDLILHTPGGETAATESLVDYLRSMFGTNIRAVVPQLAMSGGTMIACACQSILMGKHSSLGPVDPQYRGLPAHGVIEEFTRAGNEIKADPAKIALWQPIIAKYNPTLIGECQKAIDWSQQMVKEWLTSGMLARQTDSDKLADEIIKELGDHALTLSHSRHLSADRCKTIGLTVEFIEDNPALQDAVLSVHHAYIQTLSATEAFKIIENQQGVAYIQRARKVVVA